MTRVAVPAVAALAAALLAGCRPAASEAPLPILGAVPDFSLVDQDGRPLTAAALRGRVWVADFIFTHCAGPCPRMSRRMAELQTDADHLADLRLVSFSVDPARDTPEVLREYGKAFGARPGRWTFVTGPERAIHDLAIRGFKLTVEPETDASPILHSTRFMLVDRANRIRGAFDAEEPGQLQQLRTAIRRLHDERNAR